jgi:predicted ArsR family transcriptional regulator
MQFDSANGAWSLLDGPAEQYEVRATRRKILIYLHEHGQATPKQIADELGLDHENVKKACQRMARDEQVGTDGDGAYYHLSPLSPSPPEGDGGTGGTQDKWGLL